MLQEITLIFSIVPKCKVVLGVAVACQTSDDMILSGRVNVMLPLTKTPATDTGLSVLLNAFFALSQNRRELKWETVDDQGGSAKWNSTLL